MINQEILADVVRMPSGALVIRPRSGRKLVLTRYARTNSQADGAIALQPESDGIEMAEAMKILGMPYTTLRRIVEKGDVLEAWKCSPARWKLCKASVEKLRQRVKADPEFWNSES